MATTGDHDTVDWRQARQWLIDSGVIPPTHRVTKPDVALVDFARSLRDGVFLCSLLNRLQQGSVDFTARPVMQVRLAGLTGFGRGVCSRQRLGAETEWVCRVISKI